MVGVCLLWDLIAVSVCFACRVLMILILGSIGVKKVGGRCCQCFSTHLKYFITVFFHNRTGCSFYPTKVPVWRALQ